MKTIDQDLLLLGQHERGCFIFGIDDAALAAMLAALSEGTATVAAPAAGAASTAALAAPIAAGGLGTAAAAAPEAFGSLGGAVGTAAEAAPVAGIAGDTPLGNFVGPAGQTGGVAGPASPLGPAGGTTYPGTAQPGMMDMLKDYLPESMGGTPKSGGGTSTPAPNAVTPNMPDPGAKLKGILNQAPMVGGLLGAVRKTPPQAPPAGSAQQPQAPRIPPSAIQFLQALRQRQQQGY